MGARGFVFGAGNGYKDFFESLSENLRRSLEDWAAQFSNDANVTDITQTGLIGYDITHEAAAANIDLLAERLEEGAGGFAAVGAGGRRGLTRFRNNEYASLSVIQFIQGLAPTEEYSYGYDDNVVRRRRTAA